MQNFTEHDLEVTKEISAIGQQILSIQSTMKMGFKSIEKMLLLNKAESDSKLKDYNSRIISIEKQVIVVQNNQSTIKNLYFKILVTAAISGTVIATIISLFEKVANILKH